MSLDRADIARIAQGLAGTSPDDLLSIVKEADAEAHQAREQKIPAAERGARYQAEGARRALAIEFGSRHGWRLSESTFDLPTLAKGKVHNGGRDYNPANYGTNAAFDHPYYYRDANKRAAALAVHLYNWPNIRDECESHCRHFGLAMEVPKNFPSWWFPGHTILVVYKRLADAVSRDG